MFRDLGTERYWEERPEFVKFVRLQPGDATMYRLLIAQTEAQAFHEEVTIALIDMRNHGASFTYSLNAIEWAWGKMKNKPLGEQIMEPWVGDICGHLGDLSNPYTGRAIIEAVATARGV